MLGTQASLGRDEIGAFEQHPVIGVGNIGGGRHQQCDIGRACAARRTHEERHAVLARIATHPEGVDPARQVLRQRRLNRGLPPGVVQIVVMEMDGVEVFPIVDPTMI